MTRDTVIASAPGSVMITGEHAVVYGHRAMVCAIEQRAKVVVRPLTRPKVRITSQIAPDQTIALDDITPQGAYRFVLGAVALYRDRLPGGVRFDITSDIDPTLGLGSSAAVTVACLGALSAMTGADENLHGQATGIVRQIQGRGSGADLAASLYGGMLSYRAPDAVNSADIAPLPTPPELGLCYAGYKTPTSEVLAKIAEAMRGNETRYQALYQRMGTCAEQAIAAAQAKDWPGFGAALNTYQTLMAELGVSDATLDAIITGAQNTPGLLAAKISGSGLGDCVLSVGALPNGFTTAPVAEKGLVIHD